MPSTQTHSTVSQMHQGAMAGIREMQNRMRDRQNDSRFRNWSTEPNIPPSDRTPRQAEPPPPPPPPPPPRAPDPPPEAQYRPPGYGYPPEQQAYYPNQHRNYHQNPRFFNQPPRRGGGGIFSGLSDLFGGGGQRAGRANRQQNSYPQQNQNSGGKGQEPPYPGPHHDPAAQGHEPPYQGGYREQSPPPRQGDNKDSTLLQDILNGIGLDDDRILILGLILILVNDKADTTLILALLYLLL